MLYFPHVWRKTVRNIASRLTASFGRFVVFAPSDVKQKGSMTSQKAWQEHAELWLKASFPRFVRELPSPALRRLISTQTFEKNVKVHWSGFRSEYSCLMSWKKNLIVKVHWFYSNLRKTRGALGAHLQTSSNLLQHLNELTFITSLVNIQLTVSSCLTGHSLTEN